MDQPLTLLGALLLVGTALSLCKDDPKPTEPVTVAPAPGSCSQNSDCPAGQRCVQGVCSGGAVDPAAPGPTQIPAPLAAGTVAAGGLAVGSHGCVMVDGTGSYNRICTVNQTGDGPLQVKAPGTSLNPNIGFDFEATGGPDSYSVSGTMRAFDGCSGSFSGTTSLEQVAGDDFYVVKFKHCKVMVRKKTL